MAYAMGMDGDWNGGCCEFGGEKGVDGRGDVGGGVGDGVVG